MSTNSLFEFAPDYPVKQNTYWFSPSAKLLQAISGVGGIGEIGVGVSLANLFSDESSFTQWDSANDIPLPDLKYTKNGVGTFRWQGDLTLALWGTGSNLTAWAALADNLQLNVPYIKITGQARLGFTTKDPEYPGKPVYVVRPRNDNATIKIEGVGKLRDKLVADTTVKKLVFSYDSTGDSLVINSAVLTGKLAIGTGDAFRLESDVELTYKREDPQANNASTFSVAKAEIIAGTLKELFTGTLTATDVVLTDNDKSLNPSSNWQLLKASITGNLASNFGNLLTGTASVKATYQLRNPAPELNGQTTLTLESAKLTLQDPAQGGLMKLLGGTASLEVQNLLIRRVSNPNGDSSDWQADRFDATATLGLAPNPSFPIQGQADLAWRQRDNRWNNAETITIKSAKLNPSNTDASQWHKYFDAEIAVTDVVFSKLLSPNGTSWKPEQFKAKASLKILPNSIAQSSDAEISWYRQNPDPDLNKSETFIINKASISLGTQTRTDSIIPLFTGLATISVTDLILKDVSTPDQSSSWEVHSFKANAAAGLTTTFAGLNIAADASLTYKQFDNYYQGEVLVIGQAKLDAALFDFAAVGATLDNIVLSRASGTSDAAGWQLQEFTVKADADLNVPGLSVNTGVTDLAWKRRDPTHDNQQTLTVLNATITTAVGNGLLETSAQAKDVLLIKDRNGAWATQSWTAIGNAKLNSNDLSSTATISLNYQKYNPEHKRETYTLSEALLNTTLRPELTSGLVDGSTNINITDLVIAGSSDQGGSWSPLSWKANVKLNLNSTITNGISVDGDVAMAYKLNTAAGSSEPQATITLSKATIDTSLSGGAFQSNLQVNNLVLAITQTINKLETPYEDYTGEIYDYKTRDGQYTNYKNEAIAWQYQPLKWDASGDFKLKINDLNLNGAASISYQNSNPNYASRETYLISSASINLTGSQIAFFASNGKTAPPSISASNILIAKENNQWRVESFDAAANLSIEAPGFAAATSADITFRRFDSQHGNNETFTIKSAAIKGEISALTTLGVTSLTQLNAEDVVLKLNTTTNGWEVLSYKLSGNAEFNTAGLNVNGSVAVAYLSSDTKNGTPEQVKINQASLTLDPQAGLGAVLDTTAASIGVSDVVLIRTIGQSQFELQQVTAEGRLKFGDPASTPLNVDASARVTWRKQDPDRENRESWTISSAILKAGGAFNDVLEADTELKARDVVVVRNEENSSWQIVQYEAEAKINVNVNNDQYVAGANGLVRYKLVDPDNGNKESFTILTAGIEGKFTSSDTSTLAITGRAAAQNLVVTRASANDPWVPEQFLANGQLDLTAGSIKIAANGTFEYKLYNKDESVNNVPATTYRLKDASASIDLTESFKGVKIQADDLYFVNNILKDIKASASLDEFYELDNVKLSVTTDDLDPNTDDRDTIYFMLRGGYQGNMAIGTLPLEFTNGQIGRFKGFSVYYANKDGDKFEIELSQTGVNFGTSDTSTVPTRIEQGPRPNSKVFFDQHVYAPNGTLISTADLRHTPGETFAISTETGTFQLNLNAVDERGRLLYDSNHDGKVDYNDGMVISLPDAGTNEPITGLPTTDLGILVGTPGGSLNPITTLKYISLVRSSTLTKWSPHSITEIFKEKLVNVPTSFSNDNFPAYLALTTAATSQEQKDAAHAIEFSYQYTYLALVIKNILDRFGLIYTNPVQLWGREEGQLDLDPFGADQSSIVAYSALGSAVLSRFGINDTNNINPTDEYGRQAIANKFNPREPSHVYALIEEILTQYPLQLVFDTLANQPNGFDTSKFYPANRVATGGIETEANKELHKAINSSFSGFLTSVSQEIAEDLQLLNDQLTQAQAVADQIPSTGNEIAIPALAGLKRTLYSGLADRVVQRALDNNVANSTTKDGLKSKTPTLLYIDEPDRINPFSIRSLAPYLLKRENRYIARFSFELMDAQGNRILPPPHGLSLRLQFGGTAEQGRDYQLPEAQQHNLFFCRPGFYTQFIDIPIENNSLLGLPGAIPSVNEPQALTLQVKILGAHSGYAPDQNSSVASIPLSIQKSQAADSQKLSVGHVGSAASFINTSTVAAVLIDDEWVHRADAEASNTMMRAKNDGRPNIFVLENFSTSLPVIEGFDLNRKDRVVLTETTAVEDLAVVAGMVVQRETGEVFALISGSSEQHSSAAIGAMFNVAGTTLASATPAERGDVSIKTATVTGRSITIPVGKKLKASFDQSFDKTFVSSNDAYELLAIVASDDNHESSNIESYSLISQIGGYLGDPTGFDRHKSRSLDLPRSWRDKELQLQLRSSRTGAVQQLQAVASSESSIITLFSGDQRVGTLELSQSTQEVFTIPSLAHWLPSGQQNYELDALTGFDLSGLAAPQSDRLRQIQVEVDVFRESTLNNILGYAFVSRGSGGVLDPLTGSVVAPIGSQNYLKTLKEKAVFTTNGDNSQKLSISTQFTVGGGLNLDDAILVPFIDVPGRYGFVATTSRLANGGFAQAKWIDGNTIGFEDSRNFDKDYDDGIMIIKNVACTPFAV